MRDARCEKIAFTFSPLAARLFFLASFFSLSSMPVYGLDPQQHAALGDLIARGGVTVRKPPVKTARRSFVLGVIRVMIIKSGYPKYTPREERAVAYFQRDLSQGTVTIEMFGSALAGPIAVTIDGTLYTVNCQSSTAQLRAAFGFPLKDCRITAFPGLWEFAFAGDAPVITAEPAVGITQTLTYSGGLVVTDEAWRSADDGQGNLYTIPVVEALPYSEGEVKPGSVGVAFWSDDIGWVVDKWHCREFSFRSLPPSHGGGDGSGPPVVDDPGTGDGPVVGDPGTGDVPPIGGP